MVIQAPPVHGEITEMRENPVFLVSKVDRAKMENVVQMEIMGSKAFLEDPECPECVGEVDFVVHKVLKDSF